MELFSGASDRYRRFRKGLPDHWRHSSGGKKRSAGFFPHVLPFQFPGRSLSPGKGNILDGLERCILLEAER